MKLSFSVENSNSVVAKPSLSFPILGTPPLTPAWPQGGKDLKKKTKAKAKDLGNTLPVWKSDPSASKRWRKLGKGMELEFQEPSHLFSQMTYEQKASALKESVNRILDELINKEKMSTTQKTYLPYWILWKVGIVLLLILCEAKLGGIFTPTMLFLFLFAVIVGLLITLIHRHTVRSSSKVTAVSHQKADPLCKEEGL